MSILSKFIVANQHYNQAISLISKKQYSKALIEFNRTIALNPRYTLAWINRGKLQQQNLNHLRAATVDYEQALKLDSYDNQVRYRLAKLYEQMGDYLKSARHFRRILIDVNWTKKNGASQALKAFNNQEYQKSSRLMHRLLSLLDFH